MRMSGSFDTKEFNDLIASVNAMPPRAGALSSLHNTDDDQLALNIRLHGDFIYPAGRTAYATPAISLAR